MEQNTHLFFYAKTMDPRVIFHLWQYALDYIAGPGDRHQLAPHQEHFGRNTWAPCAAAEKQSRWGMQTQEHTGGKWFQFVSQTGWGRGEKKEAAQHQFGAIPNIKSSSYLDVQRLEALPDSTFLLK